MQYLLISNWKSFYERSDWLDGISILYFVKASKRTKYTKNTMEHCVTIARIELNHSKIPHSFDAEVYWFSPQENMQFRHLNSKSKACFENPIFYGWMAECTLHLVIPRVVFVDLRQRQRYISTRMHGMWGDSFDQNKKNTLRTLQSIFGRALM